MKKYISGTLSLLFIFLLFLIGGEISIRIYHHLKQTSRNIILDEELGWKPTGNYIFNGNEIDAGGKSYSVNIQTNTDGFRMFGNPHEENKQKIFFLGDSFTHAMQVSNNKTYFGILKNMLPIEVFALGGGGYGTLQEYMIIEKYIDEIRPDILVIQFCSNDFINNYYELELRSNRNNNGLRRPYLGDNEIIYSLPKKNSAIHSVANKYSQFVYFIMNRIDKLYAIHSGSVEDVIQEKGMSYPFFRQSVEITEQILIKIKSRVPSTTKIYVFSVDDTKPYYDELKRISEENEIYFIDSIPQAIRSAEQKGIITRAADNSHWNETGHHIAADILGHYFEDN